MNQRLRPSQVVIVAAGVVAFIASFLPWVHVDFGIGELSRSAWRDGLFPTYTWVGIAGALMAVQVLLESFTTITFPATVGGFRWTQVHVLLSFLAALVTVSFLIAGDAFGVGFWLSAVAAVGLVAGAAMLVRETSIAAAGVGVVAPPAAPTV